VSSSRSYHHPGKAFLSRYGMLQREEEIYRYVDFLRQESGLSDELPIDLSIIYEHFGIPTPVRAPLDEQQGILVDSSTGIILIREDDSISRQRFTEGHELMELLFDAVCEAREESNLPNWSEDHKERLCDQGAAELLMPRSTFIPKLYELGIKVDTARSLSNLCQTSLMATLVQMMRQGAGNFALIVWRYALKPTELKNTTTQPEKKLRIWWCIQTSDWTGGFLPRDKSIAEDSLIWQTYKAGHPRSGRESIDLGASKIDCEIEAIPIQINDTTHVISLLRFQ
jgi:hypothetical protein